MQKNHFYLGNQIAEAKKFTPRPRVGQSNTMPQRNRIEHAEFLKEQYQNSFNQAIALQDELAAGDLPVADGVYLDFEVNKKLISDSFDTKTGAKIMKVSDISEENANVTVFIEKKDKDWLNKKADEYANVDTDKGIAKNEKLIAPIEEINLSNIHSLYESSESFDGLAENEILLFELWINKRDEYSIEDVSNTLHALDIVCNIGKRLQFADVDVFLIKTTKNVLEALPNHLGYIEGIRRYRQPSILTETHEVNREWNDLFNDDINFNITDDSVCIGILDTGVNNAHKLLAPALPDARMGSAINVPDNIDKSYHGTDMAGLALLGDLTDLAYQRGVASDIEHSLASVKICEKGHETKSDFYGAVIEDAIEQSQSMGATINCMAITDYVSLDGRPTSSSAALDESIYHCGSCDRLVVASAGNIQTAEVDETDYLKSCKANAILSPSQAWNALTVGAFTEKTTIVNNDSGMPLAAPGALSPVSRTTDCWNNGQIKPEIVMEGGNLALHNILGIVTNDDLSLITTSQDLQQPLEAFNATSAATALASRLAAKIKTANPSLNMLSVRALMVHSAVWTPAMTNLGKPKDIMPLCGYGVPNEDIALFSNEKCATFVFENEIVPFINSGTSSSNQYNETHYYDLPWPTELLESMLNESVTMRVTLSYYVKPAPGTGGKNNKYRYPSATLHFDVKTAIESEDEFLRRRNKKEGESSDTNDSSRWVVGQQRRENGTVQSDWFTCTAQELAECGKIVVYPSSGWWKERKLENIDNLIKYSLVISIKSKETEVYQAVETAIRNKIGIQIANMI
jgi:hypothetical protein